MSERPVAFLRECTVTVVKAERQALEVLRGLVAGAVRAPEEESPKGAEPQELDILSVRLGCRIPRILRAWLTVCRGARIGPGGVFGQRPGVPGIDMVRRRNLFPVWAELGWLPVAGDGCGNYYVLTDNGTIGFVDSMKDPGRIDGQVSGDLLSFMTELLAPDQDASRAGTDQPPSCCDDPIRGMTGRGNAEGADSREVGFVACRSERCLR